MFDRRFAEAHSLWVRHVTVFWVALIAVGWGCENPGPDPILGADAAVGMDTVVVEPPIADTDGDGLCDITEGMRDTNPFEPDTDGDGITDLIETRFGSDPLRPMEPARDTIIVLREGDNATAMLAPVFQVRGRGADYTGAFQGQLGALGPTVRSSDFYDRSVAFFANPPENAAVVEPNTETFRSVVGTSRLNFEVFFRFGENTERGCAHAYPFRYLLKRSDGRLVGAQRYLLVVLPRDMPLVEAEWCTPMGACR